MKLPKPSGKNIRYKYFGYIIAPDRDDAENIFESNIVPERLISKSQTLKDNVIVYIN